MVTIFEIVVPYMRYDLVIEEDMAEEVGRILGYDKVKPEAPKIDFKPKTNKVYSKILFSRNKLLNDGYSEVMTYVFRDKGEVSVLSSASDKKFLRTNLSDGLKEALKLNQTNAPLLGMKEIKIFETGTVFKKTGEEMHVAFGDKKEIKEMKLEEYIGNSVNDFSTFLHPSGGTFRLQNHSPSFQMWSLFPFIARDMAVWVGEDVKGEDVAKVIKNNMGEMVVKGPELFDEFKKDGKFLMRFVWFFNLTTEL